MWSYYGRKHQIINKYPAPLCSVIIEPFAGTASYAYKYWDHDVILIDNYDIIIKIQKRYKNNTINYNELAKWCKERKGQTIVCENSNGNWLNFKPLVKLSGQKTQTLETMWYKENNK